MNWISGFDGRLSDNFNHLMFLDDLVTVSRASRGVARACKTCLFIYNGLIGQTLLYLSPLFIFLAGPIKEYAKLYWKSLE